MTDRPPYSCILDGVQFVQILQSNGENISVRESMDSNDINKVRPPIALKFHYTRRMAAILREEAEAERRIE